MPVVKIREVIAKQGGSLELGPRREYTRVFVVTTDEIKDGPKVVRDALEASAHNIKLGKVYTAGNDSDPTCHVVSIRPERHGGDEALIWDVIVRYTNDPTGVDNPLEEPAEFSISPAQFQQAIDQDLDGKPVVNSARQPFDPPVERDDFRVVMVISKNYAATPFGIYPVFNPATAIEYQDAVNTNTVYGFPPYTFKLSISLRTVTIESGFQYFQVSFELQGKRDLWYPLRVLNQGYYELVNPSGTSTTFTVDTTNNLILSADHGLGQNAQITFTTSGTLPAPLTPATTYYVVNPNSQQFQVATSPNGTPIDITDSGSGTHSYAVSSSGAKVRKLILDKDGKPLTAPALLDANGKAIPLDSNGALTAAPTYESFNVYKLKSYAPLNLPALPGT